MTDVPRHRTDRWIAVTLVVVAVWAVVSALHWRAEVRLSPLVTAAAFGLLSVSHLLTSVVPALRRRRVQHTEDATDGPRPSSDGEPDPGRLGQWRGVVWCGVALAAVMGLGIVIGLPVAILLLCRLAFGEGWLVTTLTVAAAGATLVVFTEVFGVFWPAGMLAQLWQ